MWVQRFDKDVDGGLNFVELVNALQTITKVQTNFPQTVATESDHGFGEFANQRAPTTEDREYKVNFGTASSPI